MKTRALFYLTTLLIPMLWLLLPLVAWAAPPGTIVEGDYIDVAKQAWIEYEQPIADPLGHPQLPWLPKEDYPFKQPYTGTELAYLSFGDHHRLRAFKYLNESLLSSRLNKRGLMIQRKGYAANEVNFDYYKDAYLYDLDKEGKIATHDWVSRLLVIYETPADVRGTGMLKYNFINNPSASWKMADTWNYSPGLRRVTRSQGGDRQDEVLGTPISNDDIGDREVWEEEHILIGEDVLYENLLDPQIIAPDRLYNTGDFNKDGEWLAKHMEPSRGEERMSPYRPDGGIECWVIMSRWAKRTENPPFGSVVFKEPKDYYLKYRITWVEKVTKFKILEEQYDHDNRLIKWIYNENPEVYEGGFIGGGYNLTQYMAYDLRRHFMSWGSYDRADMGPKGKVPDDWYTPEHLYKEYFWKSVKMPMYKSGKEFAPCPPLYRSKFPKYRAGTQDWLTKADMEYIRKTWKNHGFSDEEIDAMLLGDGVIRKEGKIIPVRKHERPAFIHGKPMPVKFPNE